MASFQFDIEGQLNNMRLAESKALWPLFETIVNSIQAIDELGDQESKQITIYAKRDDYQQLELDGTPALGQFDSFCVTDNGIGMDEENYRSFNTAYSTYKISKGCKGIGRFLWLLAFDEVLVRSVFKKESKYYIRSFTFNRHGIEPEDNVTETTYTETQTTVTLHGFRSIYKNSSAVPVNLETLAGKIIEHCLPFFIRGKCPSIVLKDDISDPINLNLYYNTKIKDTLHKDEFNLNGNEYSVFHLMLKDGGNAHRIHLCANELDVTSIELKSYMPNLQKKIRANDENGGFYYDGYILGDYLDSTVDASRTGFAFDKNDDQISLYGTTKDEIIEKILACRVQS